MNLDGSTDSLEQRFQRCELPICGSRLPTEVYYESNARFSISSPPTSERHGFGGFFFWGYLRCLSFFPHGTWQRMPASSGSAASRAVPCRAERGSEPTALPSQHGVPPVCLSRLASGGRVSHAGAGTRGTAQPGQALPGPAGSERRSAAERGPGLSRPAAALVAGSRAAQPSRAEPSRPVPGQVRRGRARTSHLRAAAPRRGGRRC